MIDLSFSEILLIAVVAIVVIGPKDLPQVMMKVGRWMGQGKAMVRQLRHGFDEMVRETELQEMEKRWAEHNQRIMEDHPEAASFADETAEMTNAQAMQPLDGPPSPEDVQPAAGGVQSEIDSATGKDAQEQGPVGSPQSGDPSPEPGQSNRS